MLLRLSIKNYALLKHVELSFDERFNVLTGETGAGKSIIIDAVKLILGERANAADIRYGEDQAVVEATFELAPNHSAFAMMDELGLERADNTIVLTRQMKANGKNTCRINRQVVTLGQFKEICSKLISIYGQHDYDELGEASVRLALLDDLGDSHHQALKEEVEEAYQKARVSGRLFKKTLRDAKKKEAEIEGYKRELEELDEYQLKRGEEEEISTRFTQAAHAQDLYDATYAATAILYDEQGSVHEQLTDALARLKAVEKYDEQLSPMIEALTEALIVVDDTNRDIESYRSGVDFDPHLIEKWDKRLALFAKLEKKYKMDVESLINTMDEWRAACDAYANIDDEIAALQKRYKQDKKAYENLAEKLHESREKLCAVFSERLIGELQDMEMKDVQFEVKLERFSGDATGTDEATFMIAPNKGMPMRPLYDIASGGEMSRIMLALKSILGGNSGIETLIFDEIDTGIGGMVLNTVADKLEELGQREQVICVTHAPSIAARGDKNFFIKKYVENDMTETHVIPLDTEDAIVKEIARMSGSQDDWQQEHAKRQRDMKRYK